MQRLMPIPWKPINRMPEDRRDGRNVLIWTDNHPAGAYVCGWVEHLGQWVARGPVIQSPTHWADITPPA